MLRRIVFGLILVLVLALMVAGPAFAAPNPGGTGQPSQSCEAQPSGPNGFNTAGFNHATTVYAGSGASTASNNTHAVSQYDVACYQLSNKKK